MNTQSISSVLCAQAEPESRLILQTQKWVREPAKAKYLVRRESHFCAQCQHATSEKKSVGFWPLFQKPMESWLLTAAAAGVNGTVSDPTQDIQTHLLPQDTQLHGFQPPTQASQPQAPDVLKDHFLWSGLLGFTRVTNLLTEIPYLLIFPSPCHSSATLRCSWCHWAVLLSSWMFARVTQCLPNAPQQLMIFRLLLYVFRVLRHGTQTHVWLSPRDSGTSSTCISLLGCLYKIPWTGWLKQPKFIFSWFSGCQQG